MRGGGSAVSRFLYDVKCHTIPVILNRLVFSFMRLNVLTELRDYSFTENCIGHFRALSLLIVCKLYGL